MYIPPTQYSYIPLPVSLFLVKLVVCSNWFLPTLLTAFPTSRCKQLGSPLAISFTSILIAISNCLLLYPSLTLILIACSWKPSRRSCLARLRPVLFGHNEVQVSPSFITFTFIMPAFPVSNSMFSGLGMPLRGVSRTQRWLKLQLLLRLS